MLILGVEPTGSTESWWWVTPVASLVASFAGAWLGYLFGRSRDRETRKETDRLKWRDECASIIADVDGLLGATDPTILQETPDGAIREELLAAHHQQWAGRHRRGLARVKAGHTDRPHVRPAIEAFEEAMDAALDAVFRAHWAVRRQTGPPTLEEILSHMRLRPEDDPPPRPAWWSSPEEDADTAWRLAKRRWDEAAAALDRLEEINAGANG